MHQPYADSIVLVTGASTGLGRAIAVGAARQGARAVVINYASSTAEAEETARQVREAGAEAVLAQGDVGSDADCRRVAGAAAPFGRIDALFNNAGTTRLAPYGKLDGISDEDFLAIYRTNVIGAYQMTRAAQPLLEAAGVAMVVMTSSLAGITGSGSSIAYTASKGALNAMTKALAIALAPKVRVNAICPGFIDSPWFDKIGYHGGAAGLRDKVAANSPLKEYTTPESVAETALFLGSRAARHTTGETVLVDAGAHLRNG
ncbi:MAG: SDR family oxidoreductase [Sphingomonadales bacterium]|nr:SDR family oxidoreductase [Sphingomonadales bacterium]